MNDETETYRGTFLESHSSAGPELRQVDATNSKVIYLTIILNGFY